MGHVSWDWSGAASKQSKWAAPDQARETSLLSTTMDISVKNFV